MKERGSIITIREHKLKALTRGKSVLGEGRGAGPPILTPNWGLHGQEEIFSRRGPPHLGTLDERAPINLKFWICHFFSIALFTVKPVVEAQILNLLVFNSIWRQDTSHVKRKGIDRFCWAKPIWTGTPLIKLCRIYMKSTL